MKKVLLLPVIFLSVFILQLKAQDTITILQYNLLYYGLDKYECNQDNNNIATKTEYLKTIINYAKPDIFGVNEIAAIADRQDYLLNNVFILNGYPGYARSEVLGSSDWPTTQIFYNTAKFREKRVITVDAWPRDFYIHQLYWRTDELYQNHDTTFLYIIEAHLKAGSTSSDSLDRAEAIDNLMNYLEAHDIKNYIIMGDFNLYTAEEGAYQKLVNPTNATYRFYDPAPAGDWHENENYAKYHTQSTNYYTINDGCLGGGGLDDRFDFFLYTSPLLDYSQNAKVINETLTVLGNDGQHFNSSIDYGTTNTSVPSDVLNALLNNSDHLPIMIKVATNQTPHYSPIAEIPQIEGIKLVNTLVTDELKIQIQRNEFLTTDKLHYTIFNISGKLIKSGEIKIQPYALDYKIDQLSTLPEGVYFIQLTSNKGAIFNGKFLKN